MFAVDTNVLLYAVNENAPEHERCLERLNAWRAGSTPWFTTWGILYEFMRVATHPAILPSPLSSAAAWSFVTALRSGALRILVPGEEHAEHLAASLAEARGVRGNLFHDLETAVLMREHGIRILYTRDQDFRRFSWIRAVDPLAE